MPRRKILEWTPSKAVLRNYEKANGGRSALKSALAELIRDGEVTTRGVVYGPVEATSARAAWMATPKADASSEIVPLPATTWRRSKAWRADQADWRWIPGNFSISMRLKPRRKMMIRKIEFCTEDLKKFLNPPEPLVRGNKAASVDQWRDFYFAVIKLSRTPGLTFKNFPRQTDLWRKVSCSMEGEEFGETYMRSAIAAVWKEFVEPTIAE